MPSEINAIDGSHDASIELLEEVLLFFTETFDSSNPLTVQTLHNLGNLHILSGNNGNDYDVV